MMANESRDPDTAMVLEVLHAASRGPQDPDVDLAEMLSELARPGSELEAHEILKRLASDAGSD